jgi:hypothetical protein
MIATQSRPRGRLRRLPNHEEMTARLTGLEGSSTALKRPLRRSQTRRVSLPYTLVQTVACEPIIPAARGRRVVPVRAKPELVGRCMFRSRGLNRSAVGKTAISLTSGRPQPPAPLTLTSFLACTSALRRAMLGPSDVGGGLGPLVPLRGHPAPSQTAPLIHLFNLH